MNQNYDGRIVVEKYDETTYQEDRSKSNISDKQLDVYKEMAEKQFYQHALSSDTIMANASYKNFIDKYATDTIIDKKTANAIQGIVHRFATMVINDGTKDIMYPVIHEYKGHDLVKTIYFTDNGSGIRPAFIEVEKSKIII